MLDAENVVVYKTPGVYSCFPDLTQEPDGTLFTRFATRRKNGNNPHADMTGGSAEYVSRDGGKTWQVSKDPYPDDAANFRRDGRGLAYVAADGWVEIPAAKRDEYDRNGHFAIGVRPGVAAYLGGAYSVVRQPGEKDGIRRPLPGTAQATFMGYGKPLRTRSGVRLTPIYGAIDPIPAPENRKLGWETSYAARSVDDGETWHIVPIAAPLTGPAGQQIGFNEPALAELPGGKILALMRCSPESVGYLYQAESDDQGKTWSAPTRTPMWGYPAHLLVLKNGDVLASYGYRRAPMGVRACLSHDNGKTWDIGHEIVLRADGAGSGSDLGYPQTVQREDGTLVTVYYLTTSDKITHVASTRWRVPLSKAEGREAQTARISGTEAAPHVISRGGAAGTYQAFPDMCRLTNGDIVAVFYAGYQHISLPKAPDWPRGGRICLVRSQDEGVTWSLPETIYDDADDNRDPHIASLPDGRLALTFFSLVRNDASPNHFAGAGVKIAYSGDGGRTWDRQARTLTAAEEKWYCSAPVRVLPSGTWILGVYKFDGPGAIYGGVLRSTDSGRTWSAPIPVGKDANIPLDAETDVIALKDGTLFAALRCGQAGKDMYASTSRDDGQSWSPVRPVGFHGEAPYLYRLKNGTILLGVRRRPDTVLYLSRDETLTWQGPFVIDDVLGGYPSIVERRDGTVLIVYYTEGHDSVVRVRRFRITGNTVEALPL